MFMRYLQKMGLAALLVLPACRKEHKNYEPYKDEVVLSVIEEKLDKNLWVQVVESKRADLSYDPKYKIFLTNETGEKIGYFGVNSEKQCHQLYKFGFFNTVVNTTKGEKDLCDYLRAKII